MTNNWCRQSKPLVLLAPMDGYTDRAFRRMIKRIDSRTIVFTEFLSAATVAAKPSLAEDWFRVTPLEAPLVVQLYGKEPQDFLAAGKLVEQFGAAGLDINMGCPAKKVVAHQHGSALLKNIDLACKLVETLKNSLKIPVTVKTRLGWEDHHDLIPFVQKLTACGLDAITIHGRTYAQKFQGQANWSPIYALKDVLEIPVFGNGDVFDGNTARQKLESLDGIMVGRAATQNPWVLAEIHAALLDTKPFPPPSLARKCELWIEFAKDSCADYPEERAIPRLRKFLIQLVKPFEDPSYRKLASSVSSIADVVSLCQSVQQLQPVSALD